MDFIGGSEREARFSTVPSVEWTTMGIDEGAISLSSGQLKRKKDETAVLPAYSAAVTQTLLSCHICGVVFALFMSKSNVSFDRQFSALRCVAKYSIPSCVDWQLHDQ
jgi:hypothetical protein